MNVVVHDDEVVTSDVTLRCLVAGEGPVVIAVHGFPDHRGAFLRLAPHVAGAGFRLVMPALRGYWPSGVARSGRHDALAAADDILALADHYSPSAPVALVGHDWGAVASFAAVSRDPFRFSRLATMAVPHLAKTLRALGTPAQIRRSWYIGLFQLRGVAEAVLGRDDLAFVERLWRDWSPSYTPLPEEIESVKAGVRHRKREVLQYYRALLSPRTQLEARAVFKRVQVPAIHVHGEEDGCIGVEVTEGAERLYASSYSLHRIAGAGHFLVQEKPEEVARILVEFLKG